MAISVRSGQMKLTRSIGKAYPGVDEWWFNRQRGRQMDAYLETAGLRAPGHRGLPSDTGVRSPHVVVVPMDGPSYDNFRPAGGNYFYEVAQSCREFAGDDAVSVFDVEPGEPPSSWHRRLIDYLMDVKATHLIAQVEKDPERSQSWWWDALWAALIPQWDGVFLGMMFDSSYPWLTIPVRRIARMSERFVLVDICMPMDGMMVRGRPEVGPVNMPVSNQSLAVIDETIGSVDKEYDVSFIGVLYPYRVEAIEACRSHGLTVEVNPHRIDAPNDLRSSQVNQPTYVDYMRGLAQSQMTINFARSSAGDFHQLKTRILEACLMGCLVLTDDDDRTGLFFEEGEQFDRFMAPADLPGVVERWLADPVGLRAAQAAARARAREINVTSLWGGIDDGLARRGLPQVRGA
jgi:hypothetical protein